MADAADKSRSKTIDVESQQLAQIYAQAGLDAAGPPAAQEALVEELDSLADVLAKNRRLEEIFASGLVSEDEKLAMLDRLFGGRASATLLNLLKVMARHGRLGYVRAVVGEARRMWLERSGRMRVEVEAALPVEPPLLAEIVAGLKRAFGAEPVVTTRVNPDLLAGFVVRIGDKVYDASARTGIERARQSMVARAIETIQSKPGQFFTTN